MTDHTLVHELRPESLGTICWRAFLQNWLLVLFALGFGTFGVGFAVLGWGAYLTDTKIVETGSRSQAEIWKKDKHTDPEDGSDYFISYHFSLAERPDSPNKMPGRHTVPKELWNQLSIGDQIEVAYDPTNPERNFPSETGGVRSLALILFATVFGVCFALVGLAILWGVFGYLAWQSYRILKCGQRVEARIERVVAHDEDMKWTIYLTFREIDGREHRVATDWIADCDEQRLLVGQLVLAQYDQEKPSRILTAIPGKEGYFLATEEYGRNE